jgi:hypothetical protein
MSNLDKFYRPDIKSETVIGTYLHPYCILGDPVWSDPYSVTEVIKKIKVESIELLITRNGGLFVRVPASLKDGFKDDKERINIFQDKIEFQDHFAHAVNRIICEFALFGIVSEPVTPVHIARGFLKDNHALITSAAGGREIFLERTLGPSMQLQQGTWLTHPVRSIDIVNNIAKQKLSKQLALISDNLPMFVASAYSLFSRNQISEALIDSWIALEQVIDWLWKEHLGIIIDSTRKKRLSDSRTYSAGVRIELLYTADKIPFSLYESANIARQHRNNLAHRAKINNNMATDCMLAMKQVVEFICKTTVDPPQANSVVAW